MDNLINRITFLENLVNSLQERLLLLENSKESKNLEIDFQKHLEKLTCGNSHLKNKYGITDITTDNSHIEIKNWSYYKHCLGQLLAYNLALPKEKLIAAFFGNETSFKERAISLMHSNKIDVWALDIINNELVIQKFPFIPQETLDFIEKHLVKTNNQNDKIKISELDSFDNIDTKFIPLVGYKLVNVEKLKIKQILLQNFEIGEAKDFVKLKDIKNTLKSNCIIETDLVLKNIIQDSFEGIEFKDVKKRNNKQYYNIFQTLTFKNLNDYSFIKDVLLENFQIGEAKDFVKLKEIKDTLKKNNIIETNGEILKNIVKNTFEGVEFKENTRVNNKSQKNIFLKLVQL